jgi:hypothetical protein
MMLSSCEETHVSHIYQEGNSMVNLFANEAIIFNEYREWEEYSLLLKAAKILM